jgi:hypothetical protein
VPAIREMEALERSSSCLITQISLDILAAPRALLTPKSLLQFHC